MKLPHIRLRNGVWYAWFDHGQYSYVHTGTSPKAAWLGLANDVWYCCIANRLQAPAWAHRI